MAKNTQSYFSHDSNARNSDKLLKVRMKHKAEGYAVYFMILERLREEKNYMSVVDYNTIAFDLRVDSSLVKSVVEDFGLFVFTDDGEYFYSESFNERMNIKDEMSSKLTEAGKKAAKARWEKNKNIENSIKKCEKDTNVMRNLCDSNATVMQSHSDSNAKEKKSKVKKSKVKKSKDNITISKDIVCSTSQSTTLTSDQIKMFIDAWNEIEELPKVRDVKVGTKRHNLLKARIKEYGIESVIECVHGIKYSSFLRGYTDNPFIATVDWVLRPNNFIKVLEGNYKDKGVSIDGQKRASKDSGKAEETKPREGKYEHLYKNI